MIFFIKRHCNVSFTFDTLSSDGTPDYILILGAVKRVPHVKQHKKQSSQSRDCLGHLIHSSASLV